MEDFPCIRLAFWRVGDRRGNLSPSALAKNKCNAVFRLVSVPVGELSGSVPRRPLPAPKKAI